VVLVSVFSDAYVQSLCPSQTVCMIAIVLYVVLVPLSPVMIGLVSEQKVVDSILGAHWSSPRVRVLVVSAVAVCSISGTGGGSGSSVSHHGAGFLFCPPHHSWSMDGVVIIAAPSLVP